jgi:hypothetical protein
MKEFRKTINDLFICEECDKICKNIRELSKHINIDHENTNQYFNKWLKNENDDKCVICGNKTFYSNFKNGYKKTCSPKCSLEKTKQTCKEKYGVEYVSQSEEIQQIVKHTCLKKYGNKNFNNSQKRKQTIKDKYGDENYVNIEKAKQTCLEKYGKEYFFQTKDFRKKVKQTYLNNLGVDNPFKSKEIKTKIKNTFLKNYGVENPLQNKKIFEKQQKSAFKLKQYKDTNIHYRGSYELDFLENFYCIFPDITNSKSIKYILNQKDHYYFPDFYIPSLNLMIEIKNSYLAKSCKEQIAVKAKAAIDNGFNYMMIIDKDYTNINKRKI